MRWEYAAEDRCEAVKQEPVCIAELSSDFQSEEMDIEYNIKCEMNPNADTLGSDQRKGFTANQVMPSRSVRQERLMSTARVISIAREFAELGDKECPRQAIPQRNHLTPSVTFLCPECNLRGRSTISVLLELMMHISNCPKKKSHELHRLVIMKYRPLISYMKRAITRNSRYYKEKLRSHTTVNFISSS
ncbi:Queuine tRNA-ribosyltransferase [Frankliniella fusca]|uniref:Queuine tRNA-ribosyltransferase n=1 Tax=Frankliniella fusca TaxID=407009 RepID=A0AAE1I0A6_9NEOP|nr:Queuine tRNA-ribosyltransferase [Frankliniella fusca]